MKKLTMHELGRLLPGDAELERRLPVVAVLDNIRSGHNVGAVLRSADAFRIGRVYCCGITPEPVHPEVLKSSLGAERTVPWEKHASTIEVLAELARQGYTLAALEQTDSPTQLDTWQWNGQPLALVLGHEVKGVSAEALSLCSLALEIPQLGAKHSLNVSVAAGVVFYEAARQARVLGLV